MANRAAYVTAGKPNPAGAIYTAPAGTDLPTDATTALSATFKGLGYIHADGLTNENNQEYDDIRAWGGDTVLSLQGDYTDTYNFTLLEVLAATVQEFIHGADNVTTGEGSTMTVTANNKDVPECIVVIDMLWRNTAVRHVIPRAKITERGEVTFVDDDVVGYEVTVTALPDSNGNSHYEYFGPTT